MTDFQDFTHDEESSNPSENRCFADVLNAQASRRAVVGGTLSAAVSAMFANSAGAAGRLFREKAGTTRGKLIDFTPVAVADGSGPWPSISPEYQWDVVIPWGEPIQPNGPTYQWPPSAADQAQQIGIGHDGMAFFPLFPDQNTNGMMCINHEFGRNTHVLGKPAPQSLDDVRVSQHAHGVSVVQLRKINGRWQTVESQRSRRIHVNTPVEFSGPVADSNLLDNPIGNAPQGTVNNCGNGETPWGTYLTCEENFNGYFGASAGGKFVPTPEQSRYGFTSTGFGYGWDIFDERFDLSNPDYVNEHNRFGWIVEIDPMHPNQPPTKRTAMGRFKHESVALVTGADGRAVAYMGDDQRFDYIYKFVGNANAKDTLKAGVSPLDDGKLYVARFNDDNTGEWLELSIDNPVLAERFDTQAELLVYTRIAADLLGATPMDRPEWVSVASNEDVYCALTNNSQRDVPNAANPLAPNPDGHIIKWRDSDGHTGLRFDWSIYLFAENTHGTDDTFSDPDAIYIDPEGRLFIETDGGQKDGLNNQLLVADLATGDLRRLFTGVTSDEITGITMTPDRKTLFINTQHPGNGDPTRTNFPASTDGVTIPRDSTIVITRKDGGIIGS
ncbi:MAG: PhoX family phosphatase [Gammaproteobacteria bacterium]